MPSIKYGKYAGRDYRDLPREYISWLIDNREEELSLLRSELERRDAIETASLSMVERIASVGYKTLAKSLHPDTGGSTEAFKELNAANEQLKEAVRSLNIYR